MKSKATSHPAAVDRRSGLGCANRGVVTEIWLTRALRNLGDVKRLKHNQPMEPNVAERLPARQLDAARIRDAIAAATQGRLDQSVPMYEIERQLGLTDVAACHAAVRHAADQGWITTTGGRDVDSVAITAEGHRLAQEQQATQTKQRDQTESGGRTERSAARRLPNL